MDSPRSWVYSRRLAKGVLIWWEMSEIRALILSFSASRLFAEDSDTARYCANRVSTAASLLSSN